MVCHPGMSSVWRFSALGEPTHRIRSTAGRAPTNLAFGGEGNRTLFITESESGSILSATMPVAGQTMFGNMQPTSQ